MTKRERQYHAKKRSASFAFSGNGTLTVKAGTRLDMFLHFHPMRK